MHVNIHACMHINKYAFAQSTSIYGCGYAWICMGFGYAAECSADLCTKMKAFNEIRQAKEAKASEAKQQSQSDSQPSASQNAQSQPSISQNASKRTLRTEVVDNKRKERQLQSESSGGVREETKSQPSQSLHSSEVIKSQTSRPLDQQPDIELQNESSGEGREATESEPCQPLTESHQSKQKSNMREIVLENKRKERQLQSESSGEATESQPCRPASPQYMFSARENHQSQSSASQNARKFSEDNQQSQSSASQDTDHVTDGSESLKAERANDDINDYIPSSGDSSQSRRTLKRKQRRHKSEPPRAKPKRSILYEEDESDDDYEPDETKDDPDYVQESEQSETESEVSEDNDKEKNNFAQKRINILKFSPDAKFEYKSKKKTTKIVTAFDMMKQKALYYLAQWRKEYLLRKKYKLRALNYLKAAMNYAKLPVQGEMSVKAFGRILTDLNLESTRFSNKKRSRIKPKAEYGTAMIVLRGNLSDLRLQDTHAACWGVSILTCLSSMN